MGVHLKVTYHDNRSGSKDHPYGFVYFTDDTRVGYAPGADGEGPYGLFPSNWGRTTPAHFQKAEAYLKGKYPQFAEESVS